MVRSIAISAACWLALLAGAAAAADPPPAAPSPPETDKAQPVKEVTLDPTLKPPVCRRYVPTGSRIATERCVSADADRAAREADREQLRRDLNDMRMRQAMRDQVRAQALADALRRRGQ